MCAEQKVCALRFYAAGGFQGTVASDQILPIDRSMVSRVLMEVMNANLLQLLPWIPFPQNAEKAIVERGFHASGMSGIIG